MLLRVKKRGAFWKPVPVPVAFPDKIAFVPYGKGKESRELNNNFFSTFDFLVSCVCG